MPEWVYSLGLVVCAGVIFVGAWLIVYAIRYLELPANIEGVRLEVTAASIFEDMVLEVTWEIPLIASNGSRRPRSVPILEQLALVRTERATYTGQVTTIDAWEHLDGGRMILNPGATATGSVWVTLPAGETPRKLTLRELRPRQRAIRARFARTTPTARTGAV